MAVISAALVTIFRVLPEEEALTMFETCVAPEQSAAVKMSVVKACITLTIDVSIDFLFHSKADT